MSKGDIKTNSINFSMPFSLREPPDVPEDLDMRNNFATMCFKLELVEDFENGLKIIKKQMDKMKLSVEPFALYCILYICTYLPTIVSSTFTKWVASKMSMVFSNVPGPKTPWTF
jgi:hypothetical protein